MIYIIVGRNEFIQNSVSESYIKANWLTHFNYFLDDSYFTIIDKYTNYFAEKFPECSEPDSVIKEKFSFDNDQEYSTYYGSKLTLKEAKFIGLNKDLQAVLSELEEPETCIYELEKDKVFFVVQPGEILNEKQSALLLSCIMADLNKHNNKFYKEKVIYICHDSHIVEYQIGYKKFTIDKLVNFKKFIDNKKWSDGQEKLSAIYSFQHESIDPIYGSLITKGKINSPSLSTILEHLLIKQNLIQNLIEFITLKKLGLTTDSITAEIKTIVEMDIFDENTKKKLDITDSTSVETIEKFIAEFDL